MNSRRSDKGFGSSAPLLVLAGLALAVTTVEASASEELAAQRFSEAQSLYRGGQYFKAARYAFSAGEESPSKKGEAQVFVTQALVQAGMEQSASYFFLQTLRTGSRELIQRVLPLVDSIVKGVGLEFVRPYLARHTRAEDYGSAERPYFQYAAARTAGLKGDFSGALSALAEIPAKGRLRAELLQLRGAFRLISGSGAAAAEDFRLCARAATDGSDLQNRCAAGVARSLYEMGEYVAAERAFDQVSRQSVVWTDTLFEQAWNAYRRAEYNRTLGRLVSYKSPALSFVHNPEIDTLRAQSYLALCLYDDANDEVNAFNDRYSSISEEVKRLLSRNGSALGQFYDLGKEAALAPLVSGKPMHRLMNRFVRSAAFQDWMRSERELSIELGNIRQFSMGLQNQDPSTESFGSFLAKILDFRLRAIREMGGAFVRNSLLDHHDQLIAQFEKMAFIKLEMLGRFKARLMTRKTSVGERERGNVVPQRRDDQFFWSFNGEFWNDELGDYVFGLESECNERS
jgi:hypothetical protein